jgi:hypothetical protein
VRYNLVKQAAMRTRVAQQTVLPVLLSSLPFSSHFIKLYQASLLLKDRDEFVQCRPVLLHCGHCFRRTAGAAGTCLSSYPPLADLLIALKSCKTRLQN